MDDEDLTTFKDSDFPRGSIRKLVFRDFLTYEDVECFPGPSMNVIVGPNGTGKSTIICGICLASGGSPKFLGRSEKVGDFIRHGKLEGYVEMYLKDENEPDGLRRFKILLRMPNNATYFINDRRVTHTEHSRVIETYNIQVGNPCTFLAQDKVKSFAEQDSLALLKNTEKAGSPELIQLHSQLEERFKEGNEMGGKKADLEQQLKKIRDDLNRVRPLAESYHESQRRNANIHTFKAKKAFIVYDSTEKEYREKQKQAKDAHDTVKGFEAQKSVAQNKINAYKGHQRALNIDQAAAAITKLRQEVMEKCRRLRSTFDQEAIANARRAYLSTKSMHDNWEKEFEEVKKLKTNLKEEYERLKANAPDKTELNEKEEEYNQLRVSFTNDQQALNREFNDLLQKKREIENRKNSMDQILRRKMESLARYQRNDNSLKAWDYYTKNKNQFQHPVYVPYLFIHTSERFAKYLNGLIANKDIGLFIFGSREDERIITKLFKVNSTIITQDIIDRFSERAVLSNEMKEMGFLEYASNCFNAPAPVKAYFNSVNYFHNTPIGNDKTDANCEEIAERLHDIRLFLTSKSRIGVVRSRYEGGRITVNRAQLRTEGMFGAANTSRTNDAGEDTTELEQKLHDVNFRRTQQEGREVEINRLKNTVMEIRKQYQAQADAIMNAKRNFEKAERQVAHHATSKPDMEEAKRALEEHERIAKEQIPKQVEASMKAISACKKEADKYSLKCHENKRLTALCEHAKMEIDEVEIQSQDSVDAYHTLKREEETLRETFLSVRSELKELVGIPTTNLANLKNSDHVKIYEDILKKFEELHVPEGIDEIDHEIHQEEIRTQVGNLRGSRDDVKRLAKLEKEEEGIVADIEKSDNVIHNWENNMTTILEQWVTPLTELVEKISENFANFFEKIGCSGEVRLGIPENKLDISQYGIDIYVKFRSYNQLRRLTAQQQSGGERSVSTMLYLMALQELCPVPFRCVDEINQGMDPTNERLVFNMMVELLSGDQGHLAHTQYFMLTPKLLPGLTFTEKVAVLMIHNSAMMAPGTTCDVENAPFEMKVAS